jgi:hypothetical protein
MAVLLLLVRVACLLVHHRADSAAWALMAAMPTWALPIGAILLLQRQGSWQWGEQVLLLHRLVTGMQLAHLLVQGDSGNPSWLGARAWQQALAMALLDAVMFKVRCWQAG